MASCRQSLFELSSPFDLLLNCIFLTWGDLRQIPGGINLEAQWGWLQLSAWHPTPTQPSPCEGEDSKSLARRGNAPWSA